MGVPIPPCSFISRSIVTNTKAAAVFRCGLAIHIKLVLVLLESQHILISFNKLGADGDVGIGRDILVLALNKLQETGAEDIVCVQIFLGTDIGYADEHDGIQVQPGQLDLAALDLGNGDAGKTGHISELGLRKIEQFTDLGQMLSQLQAKFFLFLSGQFEH